MLLFLLGLIIFFAVHFFTALARPARDRLAAQFGEMPYKGLYSLVSLAGFVLIVIGWRSADVSILYVTPGWMRHVAYLFMIPAFILLVAAYAPAGRIAAAVKHPMLAGVKLWAFAHLLVNGDVRSVILFGAFLVYAVIDRIAVKRRNAPVRAAGPFVNDVIAITVGLAAYAGVAFYGHQYIAGVALFS